MKKIVFIGLAIFSLTLGGCAKTNKKQEVKQQNVQETVAQNNKKENKKMKTTEMTTAMFKDRVMDFKKMSDKWEFKGDKPAIIDFYATWCGPCKMIAPIVEEIANDYDGKIDVYKVDVDKNEELAAMFGIQTIPTLLFIPMEGKPVTSVGAKLKPELEEMIKQHLLK